MTTRVPVRMTGLAATRPARTVTNDDLVASGLDTSDEWVRTRTGIASRGIAGEGESVVEMSSSASAKALADAGVRAEDVDLVVLATCSMPSSMPGGAAQVAMRIGAERAGSLDLNAACAGFTYGTALAADAIRAGSARTALVVGAERMSDYLDWNDRSTAVIFGDGAGAAVLARAADGEPDGVAPPVWGSRGDMHNAIRITPDTRLLGMDGTAVFRWATGALAPVAREACDKAGIEPQDLAAFVPHQANLRIIDALARALQLGPSVAIARDITTAGNTSAASVPLALSALRDAGEVSAGDPVLVLGFGAGLTYAAQVIRCP